MKSLRALRSGQSNSKRSEEEMVARMEPPQTPVRGTPSISLNFEASPVGVPMFGPMLRTTSCSSSLRVNHSSPITVPKSSRRTTPIFADTPSGPGFLPTGTVPDTPAPLQRASVQLAILNNAAKGSSTSPSPDDVANFEPLPTPMPGTNLPLEDVAAPGIMITSPSAPSMHSHDPPGYFDSVLISSEEDYQRTKTLDTESGFPAFDGTFAEVAETNVPNLDNAIVMGATAPEAKAASFNQPFPVAPLDDSIASSAHNTPSGSKDYGKSIAYIVCDSPVASGGGKQLKQCPDHWRRLTRQCSDHPHYDGKGYARREQSSSSQYWTDSTNPTAPDSTELSQCNSHEEAAAEAKLRAAIAELDVTTLPARSWSPLDEKNSLRSIVRAYAHLREGTDDATGGVLLAEGQDAITQEMKDEVETSIRVMNRTLGG